MPSRLVLTSALSLVGLMGCGVTPDPSADAEAASQTATAIVVVDRSDTAGDSVVARFVRAQQGAVDEAALRSAGLALDLPASGCIVIETARSAARTVTLVDVGPVTLESGASKTALLPKEMPDPSGIVSGFYYSARAESAFTAGGALQIRAAGGTDSDGFLIDGFSIAVPSPHDLGDVHVTPIAAGLEVTWEATDDVVYVDVSSASRAVTRCLGEANRAVVPSFAEEGEIAVHRVHREAFRAKGIDPGEVRFDVAKTIAFTR